MFDYFIHSLYAVINTQRGCHTLKLERLGWEGENPQRVVVPIDDDDDDDDDDGDDNDDDDVFFWGKVHTVLQ